MNEDVKDTKEFIWKVIRYIDSKGKITNSRNDLYECGVSVIHKEKDYTGRFSVMSFPFSNGSSWAQIKKGNKIVFEADGKFTAAPWNVELKAYVKGDWEDIFTNK